MGQAGRGAAGLRFQRTYYPGARAVQRRRLGPAMGPALRGAREAAGFRPARISAMPAAPAQRIARDPRAGAARAVVERRRAGASGARLSIPRRLSAACAIARTLLWSALEDSPRGIDRLRG